ncbi:hypothetical protein FQZ97_1183110 [compost metagenome]
MSGRRVDVSNGQRRGDTGLAFIGGSSWNGEKMRFVYPPVWSGTSGTRRGRKAGGRAVRGFQRFKNVPVLLEHAGTGKKFDWLNA